MKKFWPILLMIAAACSLEAQTNAPESLTASEPAPASPEKTNTARLRPPTQIHSNSGEFLLASNIYIYRGNVVVDDQQMKLTCDLLTVEAPRLTQGKFNQAVADGNVVIHFADEKGQTNHAFAARAIYTYSITNAVTNAFVVLTGPPNPILMNDEGGRHTGEIIEWNRLTGTVRTKGSTTILPRGGSGDVPDFFGGATPTKTNAPRPGPGQIPK
jgi:lipopolysaccharide export system protein LptA